MVNYLYSVAAVLAATIGLASANCQLKNELSGPSAQAETNTNLCLSQGPGSLQFSMINKALNVPSFSSKSPFAGYVSDNMFVIYNSSCHALGIYNPEQDNSCGAPYTIEDNFLKYVLTVNRVDFDLGGGYFAFSYANGLYTIGNNHCVCRDDSSGLQGGQACNCAFPVAGES